MIGRDELTACIVAGGRARRMGGALKPLLVVDGVTILERQRALLGAVAAEVIIALAAPGPLAEQGLRAVYDRFPDAGPLAGIAAGLAASARPWLLVVAGDMPSVSAEILALLSGHATPAVDAVVPRIGGFPEPLLAIYHQRARPVLERRLAAGLRTTQAALAELQVAWVEEASVRAVDESLVSFRNLNSPVDHRDG